MKLKDTKDLHNKNILELTSQIGDLRKQVEKAALESRARRGKNTNAAKNLKLKIAQILTIISEKEVNNG